MHKDVDTLVSQDRSWYVLACTAKDKQKTSVRTVNCADRWCVERKNMEKDVGTYLWLWTYHRLRMTNNRLLKVTYTQKNINKNINRKFFFSVLERKEVRLVSRNWTSYVCEIIVTYAMSSNAVIWKVWHTQNRVKHKLRSGM